MHGGPQMCQARLPWRGTWASAKAESHDQGSQHGDLELVSDPIALGGHLPSPQRTWMILNKCHSNDMWEFAMGGKLQSNNIKVLLT